MCEVQDGRPLVAPVTGRQCQTQRRAEVCLCLRPVCRRPSRRGHVPLGQGACSGPFLQKKKQGKEILTGAAGRLNSNLLLEQLQTAAAFKSTEEKKKSCKNRFVPACLIFLRKEIKKKSYCRFIQIFIS